MASQAKAPGAQEPVSVPMWRPTRQSFRNLAVFCGGLFASSAAVLALTHSAVLVAVTAGLSLVASVLLTFVITRPRVVTALAEAERPDLGNWPGTAADRQALRRRGWVRGGRSLAMALVVGALGGFYPVFGVAFVGAGLGGAVASGVVMALVGHFEAEHDVTVISPSNAGTTHRRLRFGVASGRM